VIGAQLVGHDHRDHLSLRHGVALIDEQLSDLPADLRADDDVLSGDDAGEDERGGAGFEGVPDSAGAEEEEGEEADHSSLHEASV
jgi:hypothetical protein